MKAAKKLDKLAVPDSKILLTTSVISVSERNAIKEREGEEPEFDKILKNKESREGGKLTR